MKRNLRGMNDNYKLILNSPSRIPKFIVSLFMTPMFSIFILAIKFDCLVLAIFQSFHLIVIFNFDKFAPPEYMFQKMFQMLFSPLQCIK